jgi:hypothetical protein
MHSLSVLSGVTAHFSLVIWVKATIIDSTKDMDEWLATIVSEGSSGVLRKVFMCFFAWQTKEYTYRFRVLLQLSVQVNVECYPQHTPELVIDISRVTVSPPPSPTHYRHFNIQHLTQGPLRGGGGRRHAMPAASSWTSRSCG